MDNSMSDLKLERETTIVFNEAEDEAMVWSASPSFHRKMQKLAIEPYKTATRERGEQSCWYHIPRVWVRISRPIQRQLTEEQRQKMAETARRVFSKNPPTNTSNQASKTDDLSRDGS